MYELTCSTQGKEQHRSPEERIEGGGGWLALEADVCSDWQCDLMWNYSKAIDFNGLKLA